MCLRAILQSGLFGKCVEDCVLLCTQHKGKKHQAKDKGHGSCAFRSQGLLQVGAIFCTIFIFKPGYVTGLS